jgi:hypothetical protein
VKLPVPKPVEAAAGGEAPAAVDAHAAGEEMEVAEARAPGLRDPSTVEGWSEESINYPAGVEADWKSVLYHVGEGVIDMALKDHDEKVWRVFSSAQQCLVGERFAHVRDHLRQLYREEDDEKIAERLRIDLRKAKKLPMSLLSSAAKQHAYQYCYNTGKCKKIRYLFSEASLPR